MGVIEVSEQEETERFNALIHRQIAQVMSANIKISEKIGYVSPRLTAQEVMSFIVNNMYFRAIANQKPADTAYNEVVRVDGTALNALGWSLGFRTRGCPIGLPSSLEIDYEMKLKLQPDQMVRRNGVYQEVVRDIIGEVIGITWNDYGLKLPDHSVAYVRRSYHNAASEFAKESN